MISKILALNTQPKIDLFLKLSLFFIFYNVFVLISSPAAGVEGFEAHITSFAQNKLMHSPVYKTFTPEYQNRPGEFLIYKLVSYIFPGDVLKLAEQLSAFAYLLTGLSIFLTLRHFNQTAAILALFTFSISFDLAATAAQASSVNLAYASGTVGILLVFLNSSFKSYYVALALSLAIFFRSDSVLMLPFVFFLLITRKESIVKSGGIMLGAFLLAALFYKLAGVNLFKVLTNGSGHKPWVELNKNIVFNFLFPYKLPLLVLSIIGIYREKRIISVKDLLPSLLALTTILVYALAYKGMLEVPRFLSFPEIIWAMVLAFNFSFWSQPELAKKVILIAFAFLTIIGFCFRYDLEFPEAKRFVGFPLATPLHTLRSKILLDRADKIIFSEIDKCSAKKHTENKVNIIVTVWGEFRRQKRLILLNGGYLIPFVGENANLRMIDSFAYRSKTINLFFVESNADYKDPSEFYAKVKQLNLEETPLLITENQPLTETLSTSIKNNLFTVLNIGKNHIYVATCNAQ